MSDEDAVI